MIGLVYGWYNVETIDFELFAKKSTFTDDTVLTMALTDCILNKKYKSESELLNHPEISNQHISLPASLLF